MKNTEKNSERTWHLLYSVSSFADNPLNPFVAKIIKLQANTEGEMLKKTLRILKRSARRVRQPKSWYLITIFPQSPSKDGRELFSLKNKYSNTRKILKLTEENVQKYFVKGSGPDVVKQLLEK